MPRKIVSLDVREILRAKQEPFQKIMETVSTVGEQDVFELHATFQPDPLIKVLGKQGFHSSVLVEDREHFIIQFSKEETNPPFFHIDNRNLEPPQPMMRTLELLDSRVEFQKGTLGLEIWNERVPAFLLPELEERKFTYEAVDEDDAVRVRIFHAD